MNLFPKIDVNQIKAEFNFNPSNFSESRIIRIDF